MRTISILSGIPGLRHCVKMLFPELIVREIKLQSTVVENVESVASRSPKVNSLTDANQDVEILLADFDLFGPHLYSQWPKLKWVQGTFAGVEKLLKFYDPQKPKPAFHVTRYSGQSMGTLMAEYTIAQIINQERKFSSLVEHQKISAWATDNQYLSYRSLTELSIGILGMGAVAKEIAKLSKALGATVWALVRQEVTPERKYQFVDQYRLVKDLPDLLKNCDYICNVLPSTTETQGLLNGNVLSQCEKKPVFINIGRGDIIREKDLVCALEKGWLTAAVLDVFEEEPLLKDSLLWTMPQVIITPHVAGASRPQDVAEAFRQNYALFVSGQPLNFLLDFEKGY